MKKIYFSFFLLAFLAAQTAFSQRYLKPTFAEVEVSTVNYGVNATFLGYATPLGEAFTEVLKADLYKPKGDTETNRPVVVYWHSGNFLPHPANLGVNGKRTDSTAVEVCTRLAKMGYVAISADYRLLWNPTSMDPTTRTFTLINAAYRGVQDCKTMSKFLRRSVAEQGNPMGIDPEKICMFGHGTGGYIVYNSAVLDTITETYLPKFALNLNPFVPMVFEAFNGDVECEKYGVYTAIPGLPLPYKPGDTLSMPNHVGYSSKFAMGVCLGGAMGDKSWITGGKGTAGIPPIISYHAPADPFAPYDCGVLIVPGVNFSVVEVCGGHEVQKSFDAAGINDVWKGNAQLDAWPLSSNDNSEGLTALFNVYPQTQKGLVTYSPWDIWGWNNQNALIGAMAGLNDSIAARKYIDSIIGYFAPRACLALDLGCSLVDVKHLDAQSLGLEIAPNPAVDAVNFETENTPIRAIYVYDLSGRLVKAHTDINQNKFTMPRHVLNSGMYFAEIRFDKGVITKKIMFE
jgi:acetyl esterase/lipase